MESKHCSLMAEIEVLEVKQKSMLQNIVKLEVDQDNLQKQVTESSTEVMEHRERLKVGNESQTGVHKQFFFHPPWRVLFHCLSCKQTQIAKSCMYNSSRMRCELSL
jgi:hypothetical protein